MNWDLLIYATIIIWGGIVLVIWLKPPLWAIPPLGLLWGFSLMKIYSIH